ncbi:MAG: DUF4097 domain-containing protein, partial [Lachnospiraceae bacterium]|nr:DUF4097 domain-containing protein [Lachnospiraceae bacterium]
VLGCAFCGIFGTLGGFMQVNNLDGRFSRIYNWGWNGLRWGFRWGDNGLRFGFLNDDDWQDDDYGLPNIASISDMEQTGYTASDITDIDIDLGTVYLVIEESEDDHIWIKNDSSVKTIKYVVENGVFRLYGSKTGLLGNNSYKGNVYLRLPKGMNLDSIDIEIDAGQMENINLEADTIDLSSGAGEFSIDGLTARTISISVGAGEMDIDSMIADNVGISVGAGNVDANNVDVKDIDLEVGMGSISMQGKITGDMDVDCGMGNVSLKLQGTEADHNYDIDCAMGNVKIGKNEYSGIAAERSIDNNSNSDFDIDCAAGNITIEFE